MNRQRLLEHSLLKRWLEAQNCGICEFLSRVALSGTAGKCGNINIGWSKLQKVKALVMQQVPQKAAQSNRKVAAAIAHQPREQESKRPGTIDCDSCLIFFRMTQQKIKKPMRRETGERVNPKQSVMWNGIRREIPRRFEHPEPIYMRFEDRRHGNHISQVVTTRVADGMPCSYGIRSCLAGPSSPPSHATQTTRCHLRPGSRACLSQVPEAMAVISSHQFYPNFPDLARVIFICI